jgi:hypothetical protein
MSYIPFGPWRPDNATLDSKWCTVAKNVFWSGGSYVPVPAFSPINTTSALPTACVGMVVCKGTSGSYAIFAGTATKLYKWVSGAWSDVSRVAGGNYNVSPGDYWSFAQFGNNLIATNINDVVQNIDVDSGTNFAAIAAAPQARHAAVVGDFLVMGSITGSNLDRQVQWSAINDITSWTGGVNLSDKQLFPDGGRVTAIVGGEVGYILQEFAIRRMRFQPGSDYVFTFERLEGDANILGKGCIAPYSAINVGGTVYYYSESGFYCYGPNGLQALGENRVNSWFQANTDTQRIPQMCVVADPFEPQIYWYCYASSSSTYFDRVLAYNWHLDEFTYLDTAVQHPSAAAVPGITLEGLNAYGTAETVPYSFDSYIWNGGNPLLGAVDNNGNLAFGNGPNLAPVLTTSELQLNKSLRSWVNTARPIIDTQAALIRAGTRERLFDTVNYTTYKPVEVSGECALRASGRYHRFEISAPAAAAWTKCLAIDVGDQPDGKR